MIVGKQHHFVARSQVESVGNEVVAFAGIARQEDLLGRHAQEFGDPLAGDFLDLVHLVADGRRWRGVHPARVIGKRPQHRLGRRTQIRGIEQVQVRGHEKLLAYAHPAALVVRSFGRKESRRLRPRLRSEPRDHGMRQQRPRSTPRKQPRELPSGKRHHILLGREPGQHPA